MFATLILMAADHTDTEKALVATPGASIAAGQLVQRKKTFLAAFAACACVAAASRATGIARQCHYNWLRSDPDYALKWETARAEAVGLLADEAKRRAVDGTPRMKFYQGKPLIDPSTGGPCVERDYSDTLLIFLLKAWAPETYGDRATGHRQLNVSVVNATPVAAADPRDVGLVPEQREAMHKLRAMIEDEGLLPVCRRRAGPKMIDEQAQPELPVTNSSTAPVAEHTEAAQHTEHEPMRTDPTTRRVGDPLDAGAGQADA